MCKMPTLQHLLGAVVLLIIVIATGATADSPNSDLICHGDRCYPRVFVPTEEFQDIEDDQTIPPGIHVVLDVTTGKRRGKLLSKDDVPEGSNATKVHDLVIGDDGSIQAIPVKNDDQFDDVSTGEVTANVSSTENMYAGLESPSDYERFTTSIQVIRDAVQRGPENMPAQLPQALSILEDLVHELDRGRDLAKNGGLEAVTQLLSMSWPASIRSNTATVIGAALSNNEAAQKSAAPLNLVDKLSKLLMIEQDPTVVSRLLYAYSNVVRGSRSNGREVFLASSGPALLASVSRRFDADDNIPHKCLNLLADVLDPDMQTDDHTSSTSAELSETAIQELRGWCHILHQTPFSAGTPSGVDVFTQVLKTLNILANDPIRVNCAIDASAPRFQTRLLYEEKLAEARLTHILATAGPIDDDNEDVNIDDDRSELSELLTLIKQVRSRYAANDHDEL